MNKKNTFKIVIAFVVVLALVLPSSAMFVNIGINNNDVSSNIDIIETTIEINVEKVNVVSQILEIEADVDTSFKLQMLDTNHAFDGTGDQLHPAFGRTTSGTHMAAYRDVDFDQIVWTFSADDGATYDPGVYYPDVGGDYPSVKLWNDTRFFGTFVPKYGGFAYLFECTDPRDYDSYVVVGYSFGNFLYNIIDADIACDSSQNSWEWGISSYVTDIIYGELLKGIPVMLNADPEDENSTWLKLTNIENCNHTDIDIDHENIIAYSVYDWDEDLTGDWRLLCRINDFEDIQEGYYEFFSITGEGNLQYPAVAVEDDNLVILAETDVNGNRDIICLYSDDGINNLQTSFVADSIDDEMYPDVRHVEGTTFICTFIKNDELYTCNTTDGGITWSEPVKIAEDVVEEYKTSDICEYAVKGMWEVDNGEDIDIHVGYLEELSDTTSPVTTCILDGIMEGGVYITDVTVTLTATDDMSGVNYTMYSVDRGEWYQYVYPFIVSKDGERVVWFYSVDLAGNIEDTKNETFTIQHPCPIEIEISGGIGVNAVITNTGNADATDVEWSITITGGILGLIDKEVNGVIPILAVDDSVTVESGLFFGFGKIAVTVTVNDVEETVDGKQIIIFTLIHNKQNTSRNSKLYIYVDDILYYKQDVDKIHIKYVVTM